MSLSRNAALGALVCCLAGPPVWAASLTATEAYYTFGSGVSANMTRLLADKAPAIGFPDLPTISFLLFDPAELPLLPLGPRGLKADLKLEHDPDALAGTLIPAEDARPVNVSAYGVEGPWDPVGGNLDDILYGPGGADAVDTTSVGDPGIYSWTITELVDSWILGDLDTSAVVLSGVFGNIDLDGRNSYAAMHTVGSLDGLEPAIHIAPIPLPASAWLLAAALLGGLGLAMAPSPRRVRVRRR